jgi:amino-acid N-acetyltransferase
VNQQFLPPLGSMAARGATRHVGQRTARAHVRLRSASPDDAEVLHALIVSHLEEGHLLPRSVDEIRTHAHRFIVAERRGHVVGCAELAPIGHAVGEVRSLVVDRAARGMGVGRRLVAELQRRARHDEFGRLCAFTHDARYFVRMGFTVVPHAAVPEKIARDCQSCVSFRRCGQDAVVLLLTGTPAHPAGVRRPVAAVTA